MSKPKGSGKKYFRTFLWAVVFVAAIVLIVQNFGVFSKILLVMLGFGAVVLVHEFGHFIVAKLSGIKVEVFSLFMPPVLLGVRKTEKGFRFRILPILFHKEEEDQGGEEDKAEETEYQVGLIPFGGFVKMLGQEDVGASESSSDPRSYANKSVGCRMAVITAGVTFNVISAVIVFMIVFLVGINLPPPIVGAVVPGSPAARAGVRTGDEIIEIAGKSGNLDFSDIAIAAALSDVNETVELKVRHQDGSEEDFSIAAERLVGKKMRDFGIVQPVSLTIAKVSDANGLLESTGLKPGDRIRTVNGRDVETYWELTEVVRDAVVSEVAVWAERKDELVKTHIGLELLPIEREVKSESDLSHIYSMLPRLRISSDFVPAKNKSLSLLNKIGIGKETADTEARLQKDDIILAIGNVENPTYKEMRDVTAEYEDKKLPIKVLRVDANGVEESLTVTVVPRRSKDVNEVLIGITLPVLDAEHAVVAKTIATADGPAKLAIPRGATITAVDGVGVSDFYDIIREISRNAGQQITLDWRVDDIVAGDVVLDVGPAKDFITVKSTFGEFIPFEDMKQLYKASGPVDAIVMGYKKTITFIAQTYVTLKLLFGRVVEPENLMGPIGILTFSYRVVAHQPLIYYAYLLGLISACIAVFNFLPLPPLDGGLIVLLLVEKVKGSALSGRTQEIIAYTGWVLIGALLLYVTFNDIVRSFSG